MIVNLDKLVEGSDAELFRVEAIDDHAVRHRQGIVNAPAGQHRPGHSHLRMRIDADNDDGFANPVGLLPECELQQIGLGDADAVDVERLEPSSLLERGREIDGAYAVCSDPEIGAGMIDDRRRRMHEIKQHTELKPHQNRRKGDTDERDRKTHAVMNEIAPGNKQRQVGVRPRNRKAFKICSTQAGAFR